MEILITEKIQYNLPNLFNFSILGSLNSDSDTLEASLLDLTEAGSNSFIDGYSVEFNINGVYIFTYFEGILVNTTISGYTN